MTATAAAGDTNTIVDVHARSGRITTTATTTTTNTMATESTSKPPAAAL